jgi:hypothetical protein
MKKLMLNLIILFLSRWCNAAPDTRVYELRIYYCEAGKLENLIQRFTKHTAKLFEKHGMKNEAYWLQTKNDSNALYYLLSYSNMDARDKSWKNFADDPQWKNVKSASEANGKIVSKVKSYLMSATDYSMNFKKAHKKKSGVYELRIYHLYPEKLKDINNRFKNFTIYSFERYVMRNIAYWNTIEKTKEVQPKLIYLLGHDSEEAAKKSFDSFRADPQKKIVFDKSEENGKIVERIESIFMKPLPISRLK